MSVRKSTIGFPLLAGAGLVLALLSAFSGFARRAGPRGMSRSGDISPQAAPMNPHYSVSGDPLLAMTPDELITPAASAAIFGLPFRGNQATYQFNITPASKDGERVDAYLFYTPEGWEIQSISAAPGVNSGCTAATTQALSNASGRGIAYWGLDGPLNLDVIPPGLPARSDCGPYNANFPLTFSVTLQIDPLASSCPGSPWVGIPRDSADFTANPVLMDSMPAYLRGDGGGSSGNPASDWKISWISPCPAPQVTLDKRVTTDPDECSQAGGNDSLTVLPGSTVFYCYQLLNNSQLVTMSLQTIVDDMLGEVAADWPLVLPALNGAYTQTAQVVSGEPGSCLTNTANWTSTTALGYGQDPLDNPSGNFTDTVYQVSDQDSATVCFPEISQRINLPILMTNFTPP